MDPLNSYLKPGNPGLTPDGAFTMLQSLGFKEFRSVGPVLRPRHGSWVETDCLCLSYLFDAELKTHLVCT